MSHFAFLKLTFYPHFQPRSEIFRFLYLKNAKVGLRMKVEILKISNFPEQILIFLLLVLKILNFWVDFQSIFLNSLKNVNNWHFHPIFQSLFLKLTFLRELGKRSKISRKPPPNSYIWRFLSHFTKLGWYFEISLF